MAKRQTSGSKRRWAQGSWFPPEKTLPSAVLLTRRSMKTLMPPDYVDDLRHESGGRLNRVMLHWAWEAN